MAAVCLINKRKVSLILLVIFDRPVDLKKGRKLLFQIMFQSRDSSMKRCQYGLLWWKIYFLLRLVSFSCGITMNLKDDLTTKLYFGDVCHFTFSKLFMDFFDVRISGHQEQIVEIISSFGFCTWSRHKAETSKAY